MSASLSVAIIFVAYILHARYQPFLEPNVDNLADLSELEGIVYVRDTGMET